MPAMPVNLIGLSTDELTALLTQAQAAYNQLRLGSKVVSVSYTQGDGARAVTYSQASRGDLLQFIRELQTALGNFCGGRRASRVVFR